MQLNWRPAFFFFLNFKETPSHEELKTIFSGLMICKIALSNQIDFLAFFSLRKMTYRNFINFGIQQSAIALPHKMTLRRHVQKFDFSDFTGLRNVNVSVTESIADC